MDWILYRKWKYGKRILVKAKKFQSNIDKGINYEIIWAINGYKDGQMTLNEIEA